tara:strand:- start:242 stop:1363 length:1122 start_codon:yes stop_codon:yes gene_type:complete
MAEENVAKEWLKESNEELKEKATGEPAPEKAEQPEPTSEPETKPEEAEKPAEPVEEEAEFKPISEEDLIALKPDEPGEAAAKKSPASEDWQKLKQVSKDRETALQTKLDEQINRNEELAATQADLEGRMMKYNVLESVAYNQHFAEPAGQLLRQATELEGVPEEVARQIILSGSEVEDAVQEEIEKLPRETAHTMGFLRIEYQKLDARANQWVGEQQEDIEAFRVEEIDRQREQKQKNIVDRQTRFSQVAAFAGNQRPWSPMLNRIDGDEPHNDMVTQIHRDAETYYTQADEAAMAEAAIAMAIVPHLWEMTRSMAEKANDVEHLKYLENSAKSLMPGGGGIAKPARRQVSEERSSGSIRRETEALGQKLFGN